MITLSCQECLPCPDQICPYSNLTRPHASRLRRQEVPWAQHAHSRPLRAAGARKQSRAGCEQSMSEYSRQRQGAYRSREPALRKQEAFRGASNVPSPICARVYAGKPCACPQTCLHMTNKTVRSPFLVSSEACYQAQSKRQPTPVWAGRSRAPASHDPTLQPLKEACMEQERKHTMVWSPQLAHDLRHQTLPTVHGQQPWTCQTPAQNDSQQHPQASMGRLHYPKTPCQCMPSPCSGHAETLFSRL